MTLQRQKQPVDSVIFLILWFSGLLFVRLPGDFPLGKMLCFCLVVCEFTCLGLLSMWDQIIEGKKNE